VTDTVPGNAPDQSIPIIPGDQPVDLGTVMPAPEVRQPWWRQPFALAGGIALVALAAGIAVAVGTTSGTDAGSPTSSTAAQTGLRHAYTACSLVWGGGEAGIIADHDHTLNLDTDGKKDPGMLRLSHVQCVLKDLSAPDAVWMHMGDTRALDGRQQDSWGAYTASWTYHPDQGLDVIITER
jgi:hypothetical protein